MSLRSSQSAGLGSAKKEVPRVITYDFIWFIESGLVICVLVEPPVTLIKYSSLISVTATSLIQLWI